MNEENHLPRDSVSPSSPSDQISPVSVQLPSLDQISPVSESAQQSDLPSNMDAVSIETADLSVSTPSASNSLSHSKSDSSSPVGTERRHMERRQMNRRKEDRKEPSPMQSAPHKQPGKPVIVYILLLFTMALLLMGLSSLMHQRSNSEVLGQLQNSVSNMRDVQNFQERIIALQEARQTAEDQLRESQREMAALVSQTQEDHNRVEAFNYFYLLMMEYQAGRYQSCQELIQEMESTGLIDSLPAEMVRTETVSNVISPLECFREIKNDITAQIAEGLSTQVIDSDIPSATEAE